MAKSLRSKWRRKCRAAKREKYAVKELARLKKTLGINDDAATTNNEETMKDLSAITITLDANEVKKKKSQITTLNEVKLDQEQDSDMEEEVVVNEDGSEEPRIYNTKTMKDQNGRYPVWMSKRKIKALKGGKNKRSQSHKISKRGKRKGRK